MHRSGTSCLTGSLQASGLYLGDVNNTAPHNAKGNKENTGTWEINDLVLSQSNAAWDTPPKNLRWDNDAKKLRERFVASYSNHKQWGFKDPRTVLTLPFWLEGLANVKIVATFRHPILVAKSLEKRNGFSAKQSFKLWNSYNLKILEYHHKYSFPIISYDWPQERYKRATHLLVGMLGIRQDKHDSKQNFYDDTLIHQKLTSHDSEPIPEQYMETYSMLCNAAESSFKE